MTLTRRNLFKVAAAGAVGVAGVTTGFPVRPCLRRHRLAPLARPQARSNLPRCLRRRRHRLRPPFDRVRWTRPHLLQVGRRLARGQEHPCRPRRRPPSLDLLQAPVDGPGGWAAVASGQAIDSDLRARARRYAGLHQAGHRHVQPRAAQRQNRLALGLRASLEPRARRDEERDRPQERRVRPDHGRLGVQPEEQVRATPAGFLTGPSSAVATSSASTSTRTARPRAMTSASRGRSAGSTPAGHSS